MGIIFPLSQTSDYDSKDRIWTGLDRNIYLYSLIFPTHYWFTYYILIILGHTYNLTEFHIRAILSHSCHHISYYWMRMHPYTYLGFARLSVCPQLASSKYDIHTHPLRPMLYCLYLIHIYCWSQHSLSLLKFQPLETQ